MSAAILENVTAEQYHADPCALPSLSASIATQLVTRSPYHAYLYHPRLGGVKREASKEMDRGSLIHALVLGSPDECVIIDADNYRTKAAQERRDEARANGLTPILAREHAEVQEVADAIRVKMHAEGIDLTGRSEVVVNWTEETPAGKVLCRGMMDHLIENRAVIFDLKNSVNAHPKKFAASCIEYGYDIQFAAYTSAFRKLRPDLAGRERFTWLIIEELPAGSPDRVILTVAEPSAMMRELGKHRWEKACAQWAQCVESGVWPGYSVGTAKIDPPAWAMRELQEEVGAG